MKFALFVLCVGASVLATKANKECAVHVPRGDISVKCSGIYTSDYPCGAAIDGIVQAHCTGISTTDWAASTRMHYGHRDWIELSFTEKYHVSAVELYSLCAKHYQGSTFDLTFSDGSVQRVERPCNDITGQESDTLSFSSILTDSVKIAWVKECTSTNHMWGLREVLVCVSAPPTRKACGNLDAIEDVWVKCSTVRNPWYCVAAIDGIVPDTSSKTATTQWRGTGHMARGHRDWIQLNFKKQHVSAVEVYSRCREDTQCSTLDLTFSDGSVKRVKRPCTGNRGVGASAKAHTCTGQKSDTFSFSSILTDSVKIACVKPCSSADGYWGAREVIACTAP